MSVCRWCTAHACFHFRNPAETVIIKSHISFQHRNPGNTKSGCQVRCLLRSTDVHSLTSVFLLCSHGRGSAGALGSLFSGQNHTHEYSMRDTHCDLEICQSLIITSPCGPSYHTQISGELNIHWTAQIPSISGAQSLRKKSERLGLWKRLA